MENRVDILAAIGQSMIAQLQNIENKSFGILQTVSAEFKYVEEAE